MPNKITVCFNGCSFTVGEGFDEDQRPRCIYDYLLAKRHGFSKTNIARSGSSNYTIFMRSVDAILSLQYNVLVVQWTVLNRLWLYPGPDSEFSCCQNNENTHFHYRSIYLSAKERTWLTNTLIMLNGEYQNIIDLVQYTKILSQLAKTSQTKLVFINGLVPWKNDLIKDTGDNLSLSLSDFSKSLLDFDNRDDNEIIKFFFQLQNCVKQLDQSLWVNPWNSWFDNIQDFGPLGHHPGPKSHQWMADLVSEHFSKYKVLCHI